MKIFAIKAGILVLLVAAVGVAALLFIRLIPFNASDVRVTINAPRELDIGSEADIFVTVFNGTRATIRDGSMGLDLPQEIELIESDGATFGSLKFREQATARFRIRASGKPNALLEVRARVQFRPRQLSATFQKDESVDILLRDLPFSISMDFPANISTGSPFTFFVRISSEADSTIGPVGATLNVPFEFAIERLKPEPNIDEDEQLWDFGYIKEGFSEEIQVTGTFTLDATDAEFTSRVGLLDDGRVKLKSYRQEIERVRLREGEIEVDIVINDVKNPVETAVLPGETTKVTIKYKNTTNEPVDDVSLRVSAEHDAVITRNIKTSEPYTKSFGEYVWSAPRLASFNQLQPGEEGSVDLVLPTLSRLAMDTFADSNQLIVVRARILSGGRILGERQTKLKFIGQLSVDAEVLYYKALGGSNTGPIPPRVGEETTYTVALTISGGTNGLEGTTARLLLGNAVTYVGSIDPLDPVADEIFYDTDTKELVWEIGDMRPGTGILSKAERYVFRIGLTPTADMVGLTVPLIETITVAGRDTFIDRILDANDDMVDSTLRDDTDVLRAHGIVKAGTSEGFGVDEKGNVAQ